MPNKQFLTGLEETIARIVSLILTLAFFALYFGNKTPISFDWYSLIGVLAIFWLVYEALAYILFLVFSFFSERTNQGNNTNVAQDTATPTISDFDEDSNQNL